MNRAPTVMSTYSTEYARQVRKHLRHVPSTDRDELVADLAERIDATSPASYAGVVERFGRPDVYAREMAEAMGVDAHGPRRWLWIAGAFMLLALVLGIGEVTTRHDDIGKYPIGFGSSSGASGDVIEAVGSTFLVHVDPARSASLSIEFRNGGSKSVHVESMNRFVGVEESAGGVSVGWEGLPAVWTPHVRVFRQADPLGVVITTFDDPSGFDFEPFEMAPDEHVVLALQGPLNYCITGDHAFEDHLRILVTIDGRRRQVEGPAVVFNFDGCP